MAAILARVFDVFLRPLQSDAALDTYISGLRKSCFVAMAALGIPAVGVSGIFLTVYGVQGPDDGYDRYGMLVCVLGMLLLAFVWFSTYIRVACTKQATDLVVDLWLFGSWAGMSLVAAGSPGMLLFAYIVLLASVALLTQTPRWPLHLALDGLLGLVQGYNHVAGGGGNGGSRNLRFVAVHHPHIPALHEDVLSSGCVLFASVLLLAALFMQKREHERQVENSNGAITIAALIADELQAYDTETATDLLEEAELLMDAKLCEAFKQVVQNLEAYRPYLPTWLLETSTSEDDEELEEELSSLRSPGESGVFSLHQNTTSTSMASGARMSQQQSRSYQSGTQSIGSCSIASLTNTRQNSNVSHFHTNNNAQHNPYNAHNGNSIGSHGVVGGGVSPQNAAAGHGFQCLEIGHGFQTTPQHGPCVPTSPGALCGAALGRGSNGAFSAYEAGTMSPGQSRPTSATSAVARFYNASRPTSAGSFHGGGASATSPNNGHNFRGIPRTQSGAEVTVGDVSVSAAIPDNGNRSPGLPGRAESTHSTSPASVPRTANHGPSNAGNPHGVAPRNAGHGSPSLPPPPVPSQKTSPVSNAPPPRNGSIVEGSQGKDRGDESGDGGGLPPPLALPSPHRAFTSNVDSSRNPPNVDKSVERKSSGPTHTRASSIKERTAAACRAALHSPAMSDLSGSGRSGRSDMCKLTDTTMATATATVPSGHHTIAMQAGTYSPVLKSSQPQPSSSSSQLPSQQKYRVLGGHSSTVVGRGSPTGSLDSAGVSPSSLSLRAPGAARIETVLPQQQSHQQREKNPSTTQPRRGSRGSLPSPQSDLLATPPECTTLHDKILHRAKQRKAARKRAQRATGNTTTHGANNTAPRHSAGAGSAGPGLGGTDSMASSSRAPSGSPAGALVSPTSGGNNPTFEDEGARRRGRDGLPPLAAKAPGAQGPGGAGHHHRMHGALEHQLPNDVVLTIVPHTCAFVMVDFWVEVEAFLVTDNLEGKQSGMIDAGTSTPLPPTASVLALQEEEFYAAVLPLFIDFVHKMAKETRGAVHSCVLGQIVASWSVATRVAQAEAKAARFLSEVRTFSSVVSNRGLHGLRAWLGLPPIATHTTATVGAGASRTSGSQRMSGGGRMPVVNAPRQNHVTHTTVLTGTVPGASGSQMLTGVGAAGTGRLNAANDSGSVTRGPPSATGSRHDLGVQNGSFQGFQGTAAGLSAISTPSTAPTHIALPGTMNANAPTSFALDGHNGADQSHTSPRMPPHGAEHGQHGDGMDATSSLNPNHVSAFSGLSSPRAGHHVTPMHAPVVPNVGSVGGAGPHHGGEQFTSNTNTRTAHHQHSHSNDAVDERDILIGAPEAWTFAKIFCVSGAACSGPTRAQAVGTIQRVLTANAESYRHRLVGLSRLARRFATVLVDKHTAAGAGASYELCGAAAVDLSRCCEGHRKTAGERVLNVPSGAAGVGRSHIIESSNSNATGRFPSHDTQQRRSGAPGTNTSSGPSAVPSIPRDLIARAAASRVSRASLGAGADGGKGGEACEWSPSDQSPHDLALDLSGLEDFGMALQRSFHAAPRRIESSFALTQNQTQNQNPNPSKRTTPQQSITPTSATTGGANMPRRTSNSFHFNDPLSDPSTPLIRRIESDRNTLPRNPKEFIEPVFEIIGAREANDEWLYAMVEKPCDKVSEALGAAVAGDSSRASQLFAELEATVAAQLVERGDGYRGGDEMAVLARPMVGLLRQAVLEPNGFRPTVL